MHLDVVTPLGTATSDEVDEVTAPGVQGEFGVLPGHTPFIAALRTGVLAYRKGGDSKTLAIRSGFCEVSGDDRVVVLTQAGLAWDQIDPAAAMREFEEAQRALKDAHASDAARSTHESDRDWAQARLDVRGAGSPGRRH